MAFLNLLFHFFVPALSPPLSYLTSKSDVEGLDRAERLLSSMIRTNSFSGAMNAMNPRTVKTLLRRACVLALALVALSVISVPAFAGGKTCNAFSVVIGGKTFSGKQTILVPAADANGKVAQVKGTFASFNVNLNTFKVTNYTLNGTKIFASKTPTVPSPLNSPLFLKLNNEQLVMQRSGSGEDQDLKVQAKDCDTGGTFQLEPDSDGKQTNVLATGPIHYCLLDSVSGRLFFTNGPLLGYDSPQLATNLTWSAKRSTWAVRAGGRIGMVTGEDAEQALALTGNEAACGR